MEGLIPSEQAWGLPGGCRADPIALCLEVYWWIFVDCTWKRKGDLSLLSVPGNVTAVCAVRQHYFIVSSCIKVITGNESIFLRELLGLAFRQ